jgi:hypothetical protein
MQCHIGLVSQPPKMTSFLLTSGIIKLSLIVRIKCHFTECRVFLIVMFNVIMLNVVMLNVIMLSFMAPNRDSIGFDMLGLDRCASVENS